MDARHILAPFGTIISRAGNYMGLDENGEPFFLPITEKYKEAVKWMHNLYRKGLIDPEHFTRHLDVYVKGPGDRRLPGGVYFRLDGCHSRKQ